MAQFPEYSWTLLSLPARFFSWRIRGNPISFIHEYEEVLTADFDLCVATSMVDIASFKGIHKKMASLPCLLYFHENQFAYPVSAHQQHSLEPQIVNLYSALAADKVYFNSQFNLDSFMKGVAVCMEAMPDCKPAELEQKLMKKSSVLPVPLELPSNIKSGVKRQVQRESSVPVILWNHRWEYDKGPDLLLEIMQLLEATGKSYKIAIVGQQFRKVPEAFAAIKTIMENSKTLELDQWGYLESSDDYQQCLKSSDMVLSTSIHDFQGLAVLEAVAAGCLPLLPDTLVYPEWFEKKYLYNAASAESAVQLIEKQSALIGSQPTPDISQLYWTSLRPQYKKALDELLAQNN